MERNRKERIKPTVTATCGCGKELWSKTLSLERCFYCLECKEEAHTQYGIVRHYDHPRRYLELELPVG